MKTRSLIVGSLLLVTLLTGCFGGKAEPTTEKATAPARGSDWAARTKEGTATLETRDASGTAGPVEAVNYWIDDDRFRIEYRDPDTNDLRLTIVSDGGPAYLISPDAAKPMLSPASAESYLLLFVKPQADLVQTDLDTKSNTDIYSLKVDRTDDIKGATTPFYVRDHIYYVRAGELLKVIRRSAPAPGGRPRGLNTSSYTFGKSKVSEDLPDQLFVIQK